MKNFKLHYFSLPLFSFQGRQNCLIIILYHFSKEIQVYSHRRQRDAAPLIHVFYSLIKFFPAPPGFFEPELLIVFLPKNSENYFTRTGVPPVSRRAIAPYTLRSDREELLHSRGTNLLFPLLFCKFIKRIPVINRIRFSYHGSKSFQASQLTGFQRNKPEYAHTKLNAVKEISEHAEGSAAWESECSKRARTPQAVGSAAGAG